MSQVAHAAEEQSLDQPSVSAADTSTEVSRTAAAPFSAKVWDWYAFNIDHAGTMNVWHPPEGSAQENAGQRLSTVGDGFQISQESNYLRGDAMQWQWLLYRGQAVLDGLRITGSPLEIDTTDSKSVGLLPVRLFTSAHQVSADFITNNGDSPTEGTYHVRLDKVESLEGHWRSAGDWQPFTVDAPRIEVQVPTTVTAEGLQLGDAMTYSAFAQDERRALLHVGAADADSGSANSIDAYWVHADTVTLLSSASSAGASQAAEVSQANVAQFDAVNGMHWQLRAIGDSGTAQLRGMGLATVPLADSGTARRALLRGPHVLAASGLLLRAGRMQVDWSATDDAAEPSLLVAEETPGQPVILDTRLSQSGVRMLLTCAELQIERQENGHYRILATRIYEADGWTFQSPQWERLRFQGSVWKRMCYRPHVQRGGSLTVRYYLELKRGLQKSNVFSLKTIIPMS